MGRHENIELLTYSEVESVSGFVGNFDITVRKKPRYIDEDACTGCGDCVDVCPIDVLNSFDLGLSTRKAVYRNSPQAVPNVFTIDKKGVAPCRDACPTDQRAMGYIALIREGRFADAYWAIRREHPFPSVCGRVCNRKCEEACSRGEYDEPVNIMGLKRFVSDWAYEHRDELPEMGDKSLVGTPFKEDPAPTGQRIAIIGAGPAGLTAGLDLVRLGHEVTVFDQLPEAGGMMRVGIPPHRLPDHLLDWEIQQIVDEGVNLELNTRIDDIPALLEEEEFDAALIATGAHQGKKLALRNSNHPDNWISLDFLRRVTLGEEIDLSGKKVAILGGGNVALDSARTAVRLGQPEVKMICLEPRGEMPGFEWEIEVAEEEGIELLPGRTFKEILVENGKITGIRCVEVDFHGFKHGRPDFDEIPNTEHVIEADLIIWAIGQGPDFSFLPQDGSINTRYPIGLKTDDEMMTTMPGVFSAGDVHRGQTFFVVDAIGEGHHAARCIDRYLRGEEGVQEPPENPVSTLTKDEIENKIKTGKAAEQGRAPIHCIPVEERVNNFQEVDITLSEEEAIQEANRCLQCGICAECLECVAACDREAINHAMQPSLVEFSVGTIVLATGFQDFNPEVAPEFGYGKLDNVVTAMEFERMINTMGPTNGEIRLKNGGKPETVAIIHCVGSRDQKYHEYCSRACCMYSLKISQLVRDYVGAEVHEIYRDIRSFGKDYEEFYNRTKAKGIHFHHGRVREVTQNNGRLQVSWDESFYDQPDHIKADMIILATGFEPQSDAPEIAQKFGISLGPNGFFREKHPKLAPVETSSEGIFLAGACQFPKDIPDSVSQAKGAAAVAISMLDQGTIALSPSVAEVSVKQCAGCGQCAASCPYDAIHIMDGVADVDIYNCKGCGTCVAGCPNKALTLIHYNDKQLIAEIRGALS